MHSHGVAKGIWYENKRLWESAIHQVVDLTNGYKWVYVICDFSILATGKRTYSSQNKTFYLKLILPYLILGIINSIYRQEPVKTVKRKTHPS